MDFFLGVQLHFTIDHTFSFLLEQLTAPSFLDGY